MIARFNLYGSSLEPSRMVGIPRLTPGQIDQVSGLVAQYIVAQRKRYGPRAIAFSAQQRVAIGGFFSPQILESTRLLVLRGEPVANPEFYPMLRNLGFNNLPDQSTMGAITFSDVVVSHELFSNSWSAAHTAT
jgi:hypothetical protein